MDIQEIVIDEMAVLFIDEDNTITVKEVNDPNEENLDIPESVVIDGETHPVTAISEEAFKDNTILTQVSIPESIEEIGDNAFSGCSNLSAIYSFAIEPIALGSAKATVRTRASGENTSASTVFAEVNKETCILYVPKGSGEKYRSADGWGEFKNIVEMESNVRGDANNDGKLDKKDISATVKHIVTGKTEGFNFNNADMNNDQNVNAADIVMLINEINSQK